MTNPTIPLLEYLRNIAADLDGDFLRQGVQLLTQVLMGFEAAQQIGAEKHERSADRKAYRSGYRERLWQTREGDIPLSIPRLQDSSYFPSLLEPRRQAEKGLLAVVHPCRVQADGLRQAGKHRRGG